MSDYWSKVISQVIQVYVRVAKIHAENLALGEEMHFSENRATELMSQQHRRIGSRQYCHRESKWTKDQVYEFMNLPTCS